MEIDAQPESFLKQHILTCAIHSDILYFILFHTKQYRKTSLGSRPRGWFPEPLTTHGLGAGWSPRAGADFCFLLQHKLKHVSQFMLLDFM